MIRIAYSDFVAAIFKMAKFDDGQTIGLYQLENTGFSHFAGNF